MLIYLSLLFWIIILAFLIFAGSTYHLYGRLQDAIRFDNYPPKWRWLIVSLPGTRHWFLRGHQKNWKNHHIASIYLDHDSVPSRDISNARWVLIQEHLDDPLAVRKGSTLTALLPHNIYTLKETSYLPSIEELVIRVTVPRRSYFQSKWGELFFDFFMSDTGVERVGWRLSNVHDVPLLIKGQKSSAFEMVEKDSTSDFMETGSVFHVGTATYTLIKLPRLALRWRRSGNGSFSAAQLNGILLIGNQKGTCDVIIKSTKPLAAIFDQTTLTVYEGVIFYLKHFDDRFPLDVEAVEPIDATQNFLLEPGDIFVVGDMEFLVDYALRA